MDTLDAEVLNTAREWLAQGHRVHLFTVVNTWGSAPRPVGAMLVIRDDGRVKGSVSGGCIEDDLIRRVQLGEFYVAHTVSHPARHLTFGVSTEEARRFGLPCGGQLELIAETLSDGGWLSDLVQGVAQGRLLERVVRLHDGHVELRDIARAQTLRCDDEYLVTIHGPQWRLFIVGAGQISEYLAPMALAVGFSVTVCDPRESYADTWNIPGTRLLRGMPDDELLNFCPDQRTAVVTLTHDPKLDDLALIDALPSAAFFVGALGSVRNQQQRRQRLIEHFDLSADHFDRLHGPVGLPIGSRTPPEIAISVMAQIIDEKNRLLAVAKPAKPDTTAANASEVCAPVCQLSKAVDTDVSAGMNSSTDTVATADSIARASACQTDLSN